MASKNTLTADELRALVVYRDGFLFWRNPTGKAKRGPLGWPAGLAGRLQMEIRGTAHYVHRLVWLYHYGTWPTEQIDHANGDNTDNRIENLREATNGENCQNQRHRGVTFEARNGRWRARIMVDNKSTSLGYFATESEALDAYAQAKQRLHPFWATGRGKVA
jgi:HNH endonuclease/AP2 domain